MGRRKTSMLAVATGLAGGLLWRRRNSTSGSTDEASAGGPRLDYRFVDRYRSRIPALNYRFRSGATGNDDGPR